MGEINGPLFRKVLVFEVSRAACIARFKNPLFLMGCFQGDFKRENGPTRHAGKRPIKVGKRPIKVGKRPINASGQFFGHPAMVENGPSKKAH